MLLPGWLHRPWAGSPCLLHEEFQFCCWKCYRKWFLEHRRPTPTRAWAAGTALYTPQLISSAETRGWSRASSRGVPDPTEQGAGCGVLTPIGPRICPSCLKQDPVNPWLPTASSSLVLLWSTGRARGKQSPSGSTHHHRCQSLTAMLKSLRKSFCKTQKGKRKCQPLGSQRSVTRGCSRGTTTSSLGQPLQHPGAPAAPPSHPPPHQSSSQMFLHHLVSGCRAQSSTFLLCLPLLGSPTPRERRGLGSCSEKV